jgi:predicted acyl esterase
MRSLSGGRLGRLALLCAIAGALPAPQVASAAPASVFGGAVPCAAQPDGVTFCSDSPRSTVPAWDGVPIDVNVGLPNEAQFGPGPYPLMMMFHGYGGGKIGLNAMRHWLDRGYATFSMTTRGFRESCGSAASRAAAGAACDNGYVRLIDIRYEVRDAQEFAALLADENLVDSQKIGAVGGSYGGGMSMALGALKNRKVMPDYSLVPWMSAGGKQMQIAAAAPNIPWSDLAYSLTPNGSTLDYVDDAPYTGRIGVMKESFVNALYVSGLGAPGFYAPEGSDPPADLVGWRNRLLAGEPYGPDTQGVVDEITQHHSSYYIDHSIEPAPLLMSSGFTDDLFPANETIRFYNRTRTQYENADLALFFGDFGHMRAQNKADVTTALSNAIDAWMDFYILGKGQEPGGGVTAFTETCPETAPSGGPYTAANWAEIAKGEIRYRSKPAKTIEPTAGNPEIAAKFNPIGGTACATADGADQPGTATYRLDAAPAGGYTLLGSPTVIADFTLPGDTSQVAARLLDVAPDGQETLVARGLWRPQTGGPTEQVFQLFPNGWTFAEGHVPKLELLPADSNPGAVGGYGRASNNQQPVTVKNLELRLPVIERPGTFKGLVGAMAEKFLPEGYELAVDFADLGNPHPKLRGRALEVVGSNLLGSLKCPRAFDSCHRVKLVATVPSSAKAAKRLKVAKGKLKKARGGKTKRVKLHLNGRGRALLAAGGTLKLSVEISAKELADPVTQKAKTGADR